MRSDPSITTITETTTIIIHPSQSPVAQFSIFFNEE
jgi:hypothetical protein